MHDPKEYGGDSESRSPRASAASAHMQRRHAQHVNRSIEGVTLPNPVRVPSRLGQTSLPGSASGTPRMGTPRIGTPRMGTPKFGSGRAQKRKILLFTQIFLTLCIGFFGMKQMNAIIASLGNSAIETYDSLNDDEIHSGMVNGLKEKIEKANDGDIDGTIGSVPGGGRGEVSTEQREKLKLLADALLTENDDVQIEMFPSDSRISGIYAHPTTGAHGQNTKYFYRFTNVKFDSNAILFYGGPELKQPKSMWYDVSTSNSSMPKAPTTLLMRSKGKETIGQRESIEVHYLDTIRPESACTEWIEEPSMLIHTRYPENMWHVWRDGYIATFQTARELGYLPLYRIDSDGNTMPLGSGLASEGCPVVADLSSGTVKEAIDCRKRAKLDRSNWAHYNRCSVNKTSCHPGLWLGDGDQSFEKKGPTLIYFEESMIQNEWSSLYSAMASRVRSFDAVQGLCFRNFVVGSTLSLDFEDDIPSSTDDANLKANAEHLAQELADFVEFAKSAEKRLQMNNAVEFLGYPDRFAERLRRGIYFGQGWLIEKMYPPPPGSAWDSPYLKLHDNAVKAEKEYLFEDHPWVFGRKMRHKTTEEEREKVRLDARKASIPSLAAVAVQERSERPIVTYVSRLRTLNRCILNERQVLRYIYWKYDVILRVTDLSESVQAVADILADTDVLIGSHGPGWMHSMFLKSGAVSLQLLPFGWKTESGDLIRGDKVKNIVHLRRGTHIDWVNTHAEFSFFRKRDFVNGEFQPHPQLDGEWSTLDPENLHPAWLYANTYADLNHLGPFIDEAMELAGVPRLSQARIAELNAIRLQTKEQMPKRIRTDWEEGNLAAAGWELEDGGEDAEEDHDEEEDYTAKSN